METTSRGHWIDGKEVPSQDGGTFDVFDPGTGELLGTAARGRSADVELALHSARRAFSGPAWAKASATDRGRWLLRLVELIDRDADRLATIVSLENGKPVTQAHHEIGVAKRYCEYYAGWADKIGGRQIPLDADRLAFTVREPLGVVGQIIPWNYPLDILLRGVAPSLASGNVVVVKPAEDTPSIAFEIAKLASEAGFPPGAFNVVLGLGSEAGAALTASPLVHALAFCGSFETGKAVLAAAAANLTPVVSLELGGKSPVLVLEDGDVERASSEYAKGILYNAGQSCVARTRLIVPERSLDKMLTLMRPLMTNVVLGHGLSDPAMGPIINSKQRDRIRHYLKKGVEEGAALEFGGEIPDEPHLAKGHFIRPALFSHVKSDMAVVREEIFGPVLVVQTYRTEDEGLALANDTPFGLSAELWSRDTHRAWVFAKAIQASHVTVNGSGGFGLEVPFGGIGRSGFGREGGPEGLLQFTRVKSIYIP